MPGLPDILPSPMKLSQLSVGTGGAEPCLGAEALPASGHALGSQSVALAGVPTWPSPSIPAPPGC